MNRIVFKNQDGSIGILVPVQSVLDTVGIQAIAEKDVPAPYQYATAWDIDGNPTTFAEYNTPYWFCMDTDIPADRSQRDNWTLDTTATPDGFGGVSNEFTDEQLMALYNGGVI